MQNQIKRDRKLKKTNSNIESLSFIYILYTFPWICVDIIYYSSRFKIYILFNMSIIITMKCVTFTKQHVMALSFEPTHSL